jgi:hypothetical protein
VQLARWALPPLARWLRLALAQVPALTARWLLQALPAARARQA